MLVMRIDEVLGNDTCGHLQASDIAIKLTPHLWTGEATCCSQVTVDDAFLCSECLQDDIFNAVRFGKGIYAPTPVAEMRPPRTADETGFPVEELTIYAVALGDDCALPFPQRPIPATVWEDNIATVTVCHLLC